MCNKRSKLVKTDLLVVQLLQVFWSASVCYWTVLTCNILMVFKNECSCPSNPRDMWTVNSLHCCSWNIFWRACAWRLNPQANPRTTNCTRPREISTYAGFQGWNGLKCMRHPSPMTKKSRIDRDGMGVFVCACVYEEGCGVKRQSGRETERKKMWWERDGKWEKEELLNTSVSFCPHSQQPEKGSSLGKEERKGWWFVYGPFLK